jgi:DNA polymerase-3 subunit epsilon
MNLTPEDMALALDAHPDYRVLRRLQPRTTFNPSAEGLRCARGIVLDTETTGLSSETDRVLELGMLLFEFDPTTGLIYRVLEVFDELEDPGFPIPPANTAIHHITDAMVQGRRIDDAKVERLLQGVSVVIAHNAGFDRPFVEQRWPAFEGMLWACSIRDIDWQAEGFGSAKLEYLLQTQGIFYEAHRAETDCWALLELLHHSLPQSQQPALLSLLETLNQPQLKLSALGSPFETKDLLKQRGYRWSGEQRCWSRLLSGEQALEEELSWLKRRVYGNRNAQVELETLGGSIRYSSRQGQKKLIPL